MSDDDLFSQYRMPTWEEDISLNHSFTEPFTTLPAPSEMPREEFRRRSQLTPELMNGQTMDEFVSRDVLPVPRCADREGYNPNFDSVYYMNGLADYLKVLRAARKCNVSIESYLDFGCATGRVLRHFCSQTEIPVLWGSDINGRHIRWLNEFMPQRLKLIHNHAIPSLPIADHSIDVVSAFSVFTHIDIFETAWLAELYRILKPGGLVYLTVHNDASWESLRAGGEKVQNFLERLNSRDPDFTRKLQSDLPDYRLDFRYTPRGAYRAVVFHGNRYLERTWGRFFKVEDIVPLDHGEHQSVFIGRKV